MITDQTLRAAAGFWQGGQPLKAGTLIFESLPREMRPKWAAGLLRLVLEKTGIRKPIFDEVLHAAANPREWEMGHVLFDTLRRGTLKLERKWFRTKKQTLLYEMFSFAELVAKVMYNATEPIDPFDEDSGWWMSAILRGFVDQWKDEEFARKAWRALTFDHDRESESAP